MADELDDVVENIRILVREELETSHRLGAHPVAVADCPVCRFYASAGSGLDGPK